MKTLFTLNSLSGLSTDFMKTQFHIRGINDNSDLRGRLLQPLERLQSLISISAIAVVLEHRQDEAPSFRAFVSLAVPGPDIHAEARDHTLEAAWLKVAAALRQQIEGRKGYQKLRRKRRGQHPLTASRCWGGPVAGRA
jgi:ribosome-associated translation inhibitor RaiA